MVQFVPFFLGQRTPPYDTAVSIQKCIRTPDIDEVGITTRHNTFFQMAGNFSFGDYFKRRAIELAWGLLTRPVTEGGYGMDPEKLWATVFYDDDEAVALWQEVAGLPPERIQRRGVADNYWSMGIPGPCGPCSEIYYDRGPDYGVEGGPEANEDRYIEIWNLVFMQNERGEGTSKSEFEILGPLPRQNIDTGMGVERIACLLQGVDNVYEIDLLRPMIDKVAESAPRGYGALLDQLGTTFPEALANLDAMHVRVALMMPNLKPPSYRVHDVKDRSLTLDYVSKRAGLAPMVIGLVKGLGHKYKLEPVVTLTKPREEGGDTDVFEVHW
jgi:alanyl-tRNA synthetase